MSCKIGAHASQHSFSNLPLIRSGPAALWMLRLLMSLVIPATPIWKEGLPRDFFGGPKYFFKNKQGSYVRFDVIL